MAKKLISVRLRPGLVTELDDIASLNGDDRTDVIEDMLENGLKAANRRIKAKYLSYSLIVFTIGVFAFQLPIFGLL